MSLLTGLLNKTCTVLRPVFTDDGGGNEIISSYTTIATKFEILFSQKTSTFPTESGGRVSIETFTIYSEWVDESKLVENDVITNIQDALGNVEQDNVNGVITNTSYKVISTQDPNGERDHLELTIEHFHGRVEGQP